MTYRCVCEYTRLCSINTDALRTPLSQTSPGRIAVYFYLILLHRNNIIRFTSDVFFPFRNLHVIPAKWSCYYYHCVTYLETKAHRRPTLGSRHSQRRLAFPVRVAGPSTRPRVITTPLVLRRGFCFLRGICTFFFIATIRTDVLPYRVKCVCVRVCVCITRKVIVIRRVSSEKTMKLYYTRSKRNKEFISPSSFSRAKRKNNLAFWWRLDDCSWKHTSPQIKKYYRSEVEISSNRNRLFYFLLR